MVRAPTHAAAPVVKSTKAGSRGDVAAHDASRGGVGVRSSMAWKSIPLVGSAKLVSSNCNWVELGAYTTSTEVAADSLTPPVPLASPPPLPASGNGCSGMQHTVSWTAASTASTPASFFR